MQRLAICGKPRVRFRIMRRAFQESNAAEAMLLDKMRHGSEDADPIVDEDAWHAFDPDADADEGYGPETPRIVAELGGGLVRALRSRGHDKGIDRARPDVVIYDRVLILVSEGRAENPPGENDQVDVMVGAPRGNPREEKARVP